MISSYKVDKSNTNVDPDSEGVGALKTDYFSCRQREEEAGEDTGGLDHGCHGQSHQQHGQVLQEDEDLTAAMEGLLGPGFEFNLLFFHLGHTDGLHYLEDSGHHNFQDEDDHDK